MYTKISGGGRRGNMANTGSCGGLADYMAHDKDDIYSLAIETGDLAVLKAAIAAGDIVVEESFFDQSRNDVSRDEVVKAVDGNHSKLKKSDEKFYHLISAPSEGEVSHIPGATHKDRVANYKAFIREDVMGGYAANAKRDIGKDDLLYFGRVHSFRGRDGGNLLGMHCHIIVSRKTRDGKKQLSPLSNHRDTSRGAVRGGFDRMAYFSHIEKAFDRRFGYERKYTESLEYYSAVKNGTNSDRAEALMRAGREEYRARKHEGRAGQELPQDRAVPQGPQRGPEPEKNHELEHGQKKTFRLRR